MKPPKWIKTKIACVNCIRPKGSAAGIYCAECEAKVKALVGG